MKRLGKKGFSLVELLVVVAIIAMLAAVGLPMYNRYKIKSAMSAATGEVKSYIQAWMAALNQGDSNFTLGGFGTAGVADIADCSGAYLDEAGTRNCFRSKPFLDSAYSTLFCRLHVRPRLSQGEVTFEVSLLQTISDGSTTVARADAAALHQCRDLIVADGPQHLRILGGHLYLTTAAGF